MEKKLAEEQLRLQDEEVPFRYSNRFWYYLIWLGGWLSWCVAVFLYGDELTQASYPVMDRFGTAGFIGVMLAIVGSYVLTFLVAFWIAGRVTDRHGTAYFYADHAEIRMGGRTVRIAYGEVRRLKYRTVLNAQHGGTGFGPMLYRLHVKTRRKLVIPCSFKEAWECKRNGNAQPGIDALAMHLHVRTGLPVKFVAR